MNDLDKRLFQLAMKGEKAVRKIASSKQPGCDRALSRLLLRFADSEITDYPGQKREKNGQFGTGKKSGGEKPLKSSAGHVKIDMSPKEAGKVGHEISTLFHSRFKGKRMCMITTYNPDDGEAYDYQFINRGFGKYEFIGKIKNGG